MCTHTDIHTRAHRCLTTNKQINVLKFCSLRGSDYIAKLQHFLKLFLFGIVAFLIVLIYFYQYKNVHLSADFVTERSCMLKARGLVKIFVYIPTVTICNKMQPTPVEKSLHFKRIGKIFHGMRKVLLCKLSEKA